MSKNVKPYLEAAEGLELGFAEKTDVKAQIFNLELLDDTQKSELFGGEGGKEFTLFVAIGPQATQYTWREISQRAASKTYCMVLNPESVIGPEEKACGIPLNIPVQTQINMIGRGLPFVRRLGLLYDPKHNTAFFRKAVDAASSSNLTIVPLEVSSKKDIPLALEGQWKHVDALWLIPDRTVISESIVAYLIKEAFLRKVPVIGYNRFFYETGAVLAFVFDYMELGQQCAHKALRILSGEGCRETTPIFRLWVNEKIGGKLGLSLPDAYDPPLQAGP